jgi:hypothetical protein
MTHLFYISRPVSLAEAADRTGLAVSTIREHLRSGVLQRISVAGQVAVAEDSLVRLIVLLEERRATKAVRDMQRRRRQLAVAWSNPQDGVLTSSVSASQCLRLAWTNPNR